MDEKLWRRLFWLQRVVEWSVDFSPHLARLPPYGVDDEVGRGRERGVPAGFLAGREDEEEEEIALFPADSLGPEADRHVDGDVLARVLQPGGVERLKGALREMADRQDRVGLWVARHLDGEVEAVEGVVEEVRVLVNMWM